MRQFRYSGAGRWFKGNTHLHSTASDGGKTFAELADIYHAEGYDFLFRTDHWVASDISVDTTAYPLLWLDGIEIDGRDGTGAFFHAVCLGKVDDVCQDDGFESALRSARAQGALVIAAHPYWCGNSLEDCLRWSFDGVEIYNHVCHWLNGKGGGLVHWDALLDRDPNVLAFAVDDAHLKPESPGWNGGWIVVNAEACTRRQVLSAIRRGNFYSSCGPEIRSIALDGDELSMTTSPIRFMRLVGPDSSGKRVGSFDGPPLTSVSMRVPDSWSYVYVEIEDGAGRRAWTNNLFVDEEPSKPAEGDGREPIP